MDYGSARLSGRATGKPDFNNIFRVWYVDANGVVVPGATSVDGHATHGFNFEMMVWGWGQGVGRSALNPTNRAEAFGMNLALLRDRDLDGWPDVWDAAPLQPGYKDGVQ